MQFYGIIWLVVIFQSTPSVGRATRGVIFGDDIGLFQSTPSVGRATNNGLNVKVDDDISIHALRGEGDFGSVRAVSVNDISIHALRGEGDAGK